MRIVNTDSRIIEKLRTSGISEQMKTLESSDWLVIDESNEDITGAVGIGGIFHVSSIQVNQNFRGKGIGKLLQAELIQEAKRRGLSFVTVLLIQEMKPASNYMILSIMTRFLEFIIQMK